MKLFRRISSPKGIPLARGEANRQRVLAVLPAWTSEVVIQTGISASTILKLLRTLQAREQVIGVKTAHPTAGRLEYHWTAIPNATPKVGLARQNLLTSIDPAKMPANSLTPEMRKAAEKVSFVRNLWARPVYVPVHTVPSRPGALDAFALPSRGIKT